jgi:hypothetical protein
MLISMDLKLTCTSFTGSTRLSTQRESGHSVRRCVEMLVALLMQLSPLRPFATTKLSMHQARAEHLEQGEHQFALRQSLVLYS